MDNLNRIVSLREALAIAFRDKWIIVAAFLIPPLIAIGVALAMDRTYQANASLLVKAGRQFVPQSDLGQAINNLPTASMQETMNSEVSILRSRDLAVETLNQVGLAKLYPDIAAGDGTVDAKMALAVKAFASDLKVDNPAQSTVINVALESHDAAVAQRGLAALVELYRTKHVSVFASPRSGILTNQLNAEIKNLDGLESKTATFRIEHALFDPRQQREQLLAERGRLVSAKGDLDTRTVELTNKVAFLDGLLTSTPATKTVQTEAYQSDSVMNANNKLLELRREEQNLLSRYLESSRPVQNVQADIAVVERFLAEQNKSFQGRVTTGANPVYDDMRREIVAARSELEPIAKQSAELDRQIADVNRQLEGLEGNERALLDLERAVTAGRENTKVLREQLHQAIVKENLDREKVDSISIVQEAAALPDPVSPKRTLWALGGIAVGMLAALGALIALILLRNTFLTADAVERALKLPVLVSLPHMARAEPR